MYQAKRKSVIEREKRENRKDWGRAVAIAAVTLPILWVIITLILIAF